MHIDRLYLQCLRGTLGTLRVNIALHAGQHSKTAKRAAIICQHRVSLLPPRVLLNLFIFTLESKHDFLIFLHAFLSKNICFIAY